MSGVSSADPGSSPVDLGVEWNFADVWSTVASLIPDAPAQCTATGVESWRDLDSRSTSLAMALVDAGLSVDDTVGLYLHNSPAYMETAFACFKARVQPVNINYRYGAQELSYLWGDADLKALVFHGCFAEIVDSLRDSFTRIVAWIHVDDGTGPCPEWAMPYAVVVDRVVDPALLPVRSGSDRLMIYTGGTTGYPKGVEWRQHDLYRASDVSRDPDHFDPAAIRHRIVETDRPRPIGLSAAPLMHGTGFVFAMSILSRGGTLVNQSSTRFSAIEVLDLISRFRVNAVCIVGEAFCLPMVEALEAEPERWDLTSLEAVSSAGMVWRVETKRRLLAFAPHAVLVDLLNSSEASGMARSVTSTTRETPTGRFRLGANAFVIDDGGREIQPGSDQVGRLAVRGHLPLGYHNDPEKTAATFPIIRGERCSVPGDLARVETDGTITLLGRSSAVVNRGGEKIYAEEVEEALRRNPAVRDVVVLGVPDVRLGEDVAAVVELAPGATVTTDDLVAFARETLASYKVPRKILFVDSVQRSPSGKVDYRNEKARLAEWIARHAESEER